MIRLKPERGQHLLVNTGIVDLLASSIPKNRTVIEIGAGTGLITQKLAQTAPKIIAFELDKQFYQPLKTIERKYRNLTVIFKNVLSADLKKLVDFKHERVDIAGNLPYQITEPLFMKIISLPIAGATFIVSDKFGSVELSKLSVLIKVFYTKKILTSIAQNSFYPAPETQALLIRLTPKNRQDFLTNRELFLWKELFLSAARGTLVKNVLKEGLIKHAKQANQLLTQNQSREIISSFCLTQILLNKSFEQLNNQEIGLLYQSLRNQH